MMEDFFNKAHVLTCADILRFIGGGIFVGLTVGLVVASTLKL